MSITLPTTPIGAERKNPRRLLLYGSPKSGKTTFASQLPNNLIIDLEANDGGASFVTALKVPVFNLEDVTEVAGEIKKANYPFKHITVDTGTRLEQWCTDDATKMYMASTMGRNFNHDPESGALLPKAKQESVLVLPNGAGYLWLRLSYDKWLTRFQSLVPTGGCLIIICHLKDKYLNKIGKEVVAADIDLTGKLKSITAANADAIGYMYRAGSNGETLRISFQSSDYVLCGARPEHLRGQDIEADWSKIFIE